MTAYLVRRGIATLLLLFFIVTVVFFVVHLLPGDPAQAILGGEDARPTPEQLEYVRAQLGLDQPLHIQYLNFLRSLVQFDLGDSFVRHGEDVASVLIVGTGRTILVALPALIIAVSIGVPLGTLAARTRRSFWDPFFSALALIGFSTPSFVVAILLVLIFAIGLGWTPSGGYVSPFNDFTGYLHRAALPILTLSFPTIAVTMRMTRSSLLEQFGMDYVRTGRSKGLNEGTLLRGHIMRNALLPVVTVVALQFGNLVTGSVIVEFVFSWPGVGSLLLQAVENRDYPMLQGVMLLVAIMFTVINFITDMSYAFIDPRIRYG